MKIGICDDEQEQREYIANLIQEEHLLKKQDVLKKYHPNDVSFDVDTGHFDCDILIMDCQYKDCPFNGGDLAQQINVQRPLCKIIFLSNYVDFVDKIYEADHVYFVQKKNLETLLARAIKKAADAWQKDSQETILQLFSEGRKVFLEIRDIICIERDNRNIRITTETASIPSTASLSKVLHQVKNTTLVRANGSAVVNLRHIRSVCGNQVRMDNGRTFEVSPTYAGNVKKEYLTWMGDRM